MKKRKGGLLQRMLAVLLVAVLVTGMVSNAAPASVLAQEQEEMQECVSGNAVETPEGDITPEEGTETEPAEEANLEGQEPNDGTEQETTEPDAGTGQETPGTVTEEEALAKLAARAEVAERAAESSMVMAADDSGTCGDNVKWTLANNVLTISGTGEMKNYNAGSGIPWFDNGTYTDIVSVVIENGVTGIGKNAFYGCSSLTSVTIADSVKSIGFGAFFGCTKLENVTIPQSITSIGGSAFGNCSSLQNVTVCSQTPPTCGTAIFYYSGTGLKVYVPVCDYLIADGWKAYKWKIVAAAHTGDISYSASGSRITQMCGMCNTEYGTAELTSSGTNFTYTGEAITPVSVTYEDSGTNTWIGEKPTDITYADNTNAGTATASLTLGTGEASATVTLSFTIQPKALTDDMVTLSADSFPHTGNAVTPEVTVQNGGTTLTKDTDYTVSYTNNSGVGTATVTVTGKGNYSKTVTKNFQIVESDADKAAAAKTVVENALAGITATNATTKEEILGVINTALSNAGIMDVTVEIDKFVKNEASTSAAGQIEGIVWISCGQESESVNMSKTIAQLTAGKYTVTVNNGTVSGGTGSGEYKAGETVTIRANAAASGKQFDKWVVNSGSVTLADATSSTTTFTMPAWAVEVTATYKDTAEEHKHDNITFTAWTETDSLPTDAGNYYLTENVTLSETWNVPSGTTILCLNGKTISASGDYRVITIAASGTLNLYDCQNAGNITGGKEGGVRNHGTFHMYGGKISGNGRTYGGGVRTDGIFQMYGGEISGNSAFYYGGGVYVDGGTFSMCGGKISGNTNDMGGGVYIYNGTFTVGGTAIISGNTYSGKENNVYLADGQTITIDSEHPLSSAAKIGITTRTAPTEGKPVSVTGHNKGDYSSYFHSDNSAYEIVNANDVVQLTVKAQPHTHNLTLTPAKSATCTEDGNTAYYTCDGCDKWFLDAAGTQEITDKDSVVIVKTGHSYDNSAWGYRGADGHAHKCRNCDAHDTVLAHTPGAAATATTPQTCTVCGYVIAPAIGESHTHNYGDWQHDSTQHWKVCSCGAETGRENHDFGDWVTDQPATATEPGTKHRECQTCGYRQTETIPATGTEPGTGTVTPEVKPGVNAPATDISTPAEELEDMLLTEEEKQQVQNGTNIRIVLEVQDAGSTVSDSDQAAIRQALNGFSVGQYLNVDLYKLAGADRTDITETAKKIRIVITVPDSLKNADSSETRTFAVIRVHDGRAELLTDLDDSVDTITIETDRFSTYAVVYKDTANSGGGSDNGNNGNDNSSSDNSSQNNSDKNDTKPDSSKDNEPKTGDAAPIELYATLAMIAGFSYLRLYFADRERGMTEETKRELVSRLVGWAKQGGRLRKCLAIAAVFVLLVYYHSIGKRMCVEWKAIYGE